MTAEKLKKILTNIVLRTVSIKGCLLTRASGTVQAIQANTISTLWRRASQFPYNIADERKRISCLNAAKQPERELGIIKLLFRL